MTKPTLLLIPGLWETPAVYAGITKTLTSPPYSFKVETASLRSAGSHSPGNPSMSDDIKGMKEVLQKIVERGEEVVVVMHSAGGFLGSAAIEGLTKATREKEGKRGGVVKLVFLTAGVLEVGQAHPDEDLPFMDVESGREQGIMTCQTPEKLLFNDLPPSVASEWISKFKSHPLTGWNESVSYCGWKDVPSVYLICENDQCLPVHMQEHFAGVIGGKVERCGSGHMVMLSMPERVVEVIVGTAGDV